MPIPDRTIELIRRRVNSYLDDTCRIERESGSPGLMGERLRDLLLVASNVSCRVIRLTKRTNTAAQEVGGQEALVERYRLILPVGTAFAVDDRVVMSNGDVYQVVDVEDHMSDGAFVGAMLTRVRE